MVDLSSGSVTARVDVYPDEETWKRSSSDKMTFLLENVTKVRMAKSKTHPFAFEIVEAEPVLVFSGVNDTESFDWITTFKKILWPHKEEPEQGINTICYVLVRIGNQLPSGIYKDAGAELV